MARLAVLLALAAIAAGCTAPAPGPDPSRVLVPAEGGAVRVEVASSPVNANGTLLLARRSDDAWLLLDAATGAERAHAIPPQAREPRWSPLDPNSAYYLDGNALYRYDARRAESTRIGEYALYERIGSGGRGDVVLLPDGHLKLALVGERLDGGQDLLLLSIRERATFGRETVSSTRWPLVEPATGAMLTPLGRAMAFDRDARARVFAQDGSLLATLDESPLDFCLVEDEDARIVLDGARLSIAPLLGGPARDLGEGARASCRGVDAEGLALVQGSDGIAVVALEGAAARWPFHEGRAEGASPSRDLDAVFFTRDGALVRVDAPGPTADAIASRVHGR